MKISIAASEATALISLAVATPLLAAPVTAEPPVTTIGIADFVDRRLSGASVVRVPDADVHRRTNVQLTIDRSGKVTDVRLADDSPTLTLGQVTPVVRAWTFPPQFFDGRPVRVVTQALLSARPPLEAQSPRSFPEVPVEQIEVTLRRSACYGVCPAYSLSVRGDGRVRFAGTSSVDDEDEPAVRKPWGANTLWPAPPDSRIEPTAARALIERFRSANFLGLRDIYSANVVDNPSSTLSLAAGPLTKTVLDNYGDWVGMPPVVAELETAVDRASGANRWIDGSGQSIAELRASGLDLRSRRAADLLQAAAAREVVGGADERSELIAAVLRHGIDLSIPVLANGKRKGTTRPLGRVLLDYAALAGDEPTFAILRRRGLLGRMTLAERTRALRFAGCSAAIVRALVASGVDHRALQTGTNPLHQLDQDYGDPCSGKTTAARLSFVQALLAGGVPVDSFDEDKLTPLMKLRDPQIIVMLLAAGADPNLRAPDGATPLSSARDDRVALLLLRAGAKPQGGGKDRWSLDSDKALFPATLAWLAAHGIR